MPESTSTRTAWSAVKHAATRLHADPRDIDKWKRLRTACDRYLVLFMPNRLPATRARMAYLILKDEPGTDPAGETDALATAALVAVLFDDG